MALIKRLDNKAVFILIQFNHYDVIVKIIIGVTLWNINIYIPF
jgi:hypothetical protein